MTRQSRRLDNAAFQTRIKALTQNPEPDGGLAATKALSERNRPIRKVSRKDQIKRQKKAGLVLWSLVVRKRDGNRCLMCGKTEYLQAHHWLFRRSHSVRLALDPANGATLCYGCHIGRIHHDGDGDFMLRLAEKMTSIVGQDKITAMREIARNVGPVGLEEIQIANDKLKADLGGI